MVVTGWVVGVVVVGGEVGGVVGVVAGGAVGCVVGGVVTIVVGGAVGEVVALGRVAPVDDGVVVERLGAVVVLGAPGVEALAALAVTTTDHLPQVSVTFPLTWPVPVSSANQNSAFPP